MADEGEEPKERPRKSPRLDLDLLVDAAAAASDSGRGEAVAAPEVSSLREGGTEGTSDNKQCNHVPTDSAHLRTLSSSLLSLRAARCKLCVHPIEGTHILVCLECGRHFCSGVGSVEYPYGHSRAHAREQQHWVAALSEDPKSAFCFKCDSVVDGPPHTTTELLAAAEANSGSSDVSWPDSDISVANEPCTHVPTDIAHMKLLESSLISEHAGKCVLCKTFKFKESGIMVCMECGLHFCTGIGSVDSPSGHSRLHAKQKQHWVAALFDEPQSAYCFKCEYVVCVAEPPDDVETDGFKAGGHASGLSLDLSNLIQGLSNTFRSAHIHGYAVRGMPNMGNTCYFNAVVQCLLVLDKLRARMFEPDASKGLFAESLRELFVGTIAAGSLLNPEKLLQLLCMYQKDFRGYGMHDSHELLLALLNAMDEDEKNTRDKQNSAPEVIKTIFGVQMCERRTCRCLCNSVSHPDRELNLSLPLVQSHPVVSAAPRGTCENSKSQLNMVSTQLFPTNKQSKSERIQTVAEGGDSHLPCSELKDVVVVEKPGPLEVDATEIQHIHQSKDVVQSPLRIQEVKITCPGFSERIAEVPVKSASLLPLSMFDVKVEEMDKTTADSVASIEDCLSLFLNDVLEWRCDNCSKVNNEMSANQSKNSEHMVASMEETTTVEQSDRMTCKNDQSSGSDSLSVKSKSSSSRQPHGSEAQGQIIQTDKVTGRTNLGHHGEDISMQTKMYQERKMQAELGHSAYQLEDNRNEKKDRNGSAVQTRRFVNLPPVLTLHLKRSITPELKISDHVKYKEYLDVEPFMDPSSVDKANFIYRLVGVIEHRGTESVQKGHYVAYVRARKLGNPQQQGSCSHSWFCADDRIISEVSLEDVLQRQAYILFYERMEDCSE